MHLNRARARRRPPLASAKRSVKPVLPELDVARVRQWAEGRVPPEIRDEIRIEVDVDARALTVLECRPPWSPKTIGPEWTRVPIARLRYVQSHRLWTLYWRDRNRSFHRYDLIEPSSHVATLLAEIDADPICIFWG